MVAFRRAVALAGGRNINVGDVAASLLDWSDRRRMRWAFDYYGAGIAAPKQTDTRFHRRRGLIAMARFVQLHLLTFYPPANLNRDDTGRPKTAIIGGVERLRISSQSLKRAVRTSDVFKAKLDGHLAQRTQRLGADILKHLVEKGMEEKAALATARKIAEVFGKLEDEKADNPVLHPPACLHLAGGA